MFVQRIMLIEGSGRCFWMADVLYYRNLDESLAWLPGGPRNSIGNGAFS